MGAILFVRSKHSHGSQHIEGVGRQVEVIEAGWHNRLLTAKLYGNVGPLESESSVTIRGSGEATEEIVITSLSIAPDGSVELRIAGLLFLIGLPSSGGRSA